MDPNKTPALEPPPGVKSNLVDPYSQQSTLIVVSIVCIVLCTIGVAARFYTRLAVFKQFDTTDGKSLHTYSPVNSPAAHHSHADKAFRCSFAIIGKHRYIQGLARKV